MPRNLLSAILKLIKLQFVQRGNVIGTQSASIAFSSSVKDDVWHRQKGPRSYEWWYFDAVSDDGREAVTIQFLDNFVYSPRYNRPESNIEDGTKFPAVAFTYFRNGKAVCRCVNEYRSDDFAANEDEPSCTIGSSGFHFDSASYGAGYFVEIKEPLPGGRRIEASFEWLSIEADFKPDASRNYGSQHRWNLVAPRSDVTGKIRIVGRRGREVKKFSFRGTGYHDHILDDRWMAQTITDTHWGRAHFADRTAVFYRLRENDTDGGDTKLVFIRDGRLDERTATFEEQAYARDAYGIRFPSRLRLLSESVRLRVKPLYVVDSSFYFLRFLSEITLTAKDGVPRKAMGITEYIAPGPLRFRWLNRLSDIRTGKNGRGAYF